MAAHYLGVATARQSALVQGRVPLGRATNETGEKDNQNFNTIACTNTPETLWLNNPDIEIRHTSAILE